MVLRSDEMANREQEERDQKFRGNIGKGVKTAATIGAATVAPAIASRLAPFFSEFIPMDLAMKGISKISPKLGEFLQKGQSKGLDIKEGLDFLKNKIMPGQQDNESSKKAEVEDENIITQYSPKLFSLIQKSMEGGRTIEEVEGIARSPEHKFDKTIKNMENSLGMTFYDIVRSVFGGPKRNEKKENNMATQGQQQAQPQQPQQQSAPGQGQKALLDIMQKINQKLGG